MKTLARLAACASLSLLLGCPADPATPAEEGSGRASVDGDPAADGEVPALTADGAAEVAEAWIASGGSDEALLLSEASAELLAASLTTRLDLGGEAPSSVELSSGGSREPEDEALADDTFALETPAGRSDAVISYDLTYQVTTAAGSQEVVVSLRPTATGWRVLPPPPAPDEQGD